MFIIFNLICDILIGLKCNLRLGVGGNILLTLILSLVYINSLISLINNSSPIGYNIILIVVLIIFILLYIII